MSRHLICSGICIQTDGWIHCSQLPVWSFFLICYLSLTDVYFWLIQNLESSRSYLPLAKSAFHLLRCRFSSGVCNQLGTQGWSSCHCCFAFIWQWYHSVTWWWKGAAVAQEERQYLLIGRSPTKEFCLCECLWARYWTPNSLQGIVIGVWDG